ncbi:MFS transporter [Neobacillus mesonae]|uniref:MFS transporter n=1 Tax=Neobacillus mesonae TaxID=1193713 RepID=UPI002040C03A|nr:MFS transporter [Neobacillus mesonae]MCM3568461.1 MFS transporter [Neobacillus mesonae]
MQMKNTKILYIVTLASFLGPFTQTIYAPLLPELTSIFETTQLLANISISIFTFTLAFMQMVYGPISDLKGRRKVLLFGIFIYLLGSLGCSISSSIYLFLLFRAVQAIGIASGSVAATAVIGDLFQGRERFRAMGTFQMLMALGPVLGPVAGGFLAGMFHLHLIFLFLSFTGLLIFIANYFFLPETKSQEHKNNKFKLKYFSLVFQNPVGMAVVLLGFIQYYSFYNYLIFMPEILTSRYSLSMEQKGLLFLPLSLSILIGSYFGGRLQERFKAEKCLIFTSLFNVLGIVLFIFFAKVSLILLILSSVLFGLFLGLSLPVQTTLLTSAFVMNRATAIGVYNFFRYMGMALGPILGSILFKLGDIYLLFSITACTFFGIVLFVRAKLLKNVHLSNSFDV